MADPKKPDNIVRKVFDKPQQPEKVSALFTHFKRTPKVAPAKASEKAAAARRLPAALDFGTGGVKLVQLTVDAKGEIEVAVMDEELYPSGARDPQTQKKQALEKLLSRHKVGPEVLIGLPSKEATCVNLSFPAMGGADLREAVGWKIKQLRPLDAETDKLRTAVIPWTSTVPGQTQSTSQQRVTVVCALADAIDEKIGLAHAFGLKTQSVLVSSLQLVHLSKFRRDKSPADEIVLWLDLGADETVLIVEKGGDVCFSRALSITSRQLTRALAQTLRTTETEAENLKRRHGLELWAPGKEPASLTDDERKSPAGQVYLALISTLENLVVDLEHSFKHFSYQVTQSQIQRFDRLVIAGGGSNLRNLDRFFAERLGVPAERIDALASMRVNAAARSSRADFPNDSSVFSPALGLSLTSFSEKAKGLNLATLEKRPAAGRGFRMPKLKPSTVAAAAAVVMALLVAPQALNLQRVQMKASSLNSQVKAARAKMTEMQQQQLAFAEKEKTIAESNNVLEEKIRQFRMAGREKKQFSAILAKLSEVLPPDVWITQLTYEDRGLTIVGGATKTEIVAGVIDSLKKPEDFSDVTFRYTQRDETTSTYRFEIAMSVR